MRNYRSLSEITEEYLRNHPEEVDSFVSLLFEEYALDGDTAALLSSLRIVGRVKGISTIAENSGLSRKGVQKSLSDDGNPKFDECYHARHGLSFGSAKIAALSLTYVSPFTLI